MKSQISPNPTPTLCPSVNAAKNCVAKNMKIKHLCACFEKKAVINNGMIATPHEKENKTESLFGL